MENYIVINGKKAELTEEQLRQLGIVMKNKSPFTREPNGVYYWIDCHGELWVNHDTFDILDNESYAVANYCTNKDLMQQRAWHETLSRLLWRYSMEHDGDKIDWSDKHKYKYRIDSNSNIKSFDINQFVSCKTEGTTYFYTKEIAQNAIEEIVKPFMAEHPDFKW